jgi:hypothetical protein
MTTNTENKFYPIAASNHTISPEVAADLAVAADTLFTTEEIIDASAILNTLLSRKELMGRFALINTLSAANARLLQRHLLAHPELTPEVEIRELAARVVTRMWSRPENELLGAAELLGRHRDGNLNALDADTRHLLETEDASTGLLVSALLATGLSAIVSHEAGLPNHGDGIREVLSVQYCGVPMVPMMIVSRPGIS